MGSGRAAEAFDDGFEEAAEDEELLGESIAEAETRAIREDEGGDGDGDKDAEEHFADAIDGEAPAGAGLLDEHDDGDGDTGEAGAVAQTEEATDENGDEDGGDVIPGQGAEEGEEKAEERAQEGAKDAVARGGDGGAEVGLEDNDGADGSPVAVVKAEEAGDPPAERGGEGCFGGMNEKTAALPGEEALVEMRSDAQLDGKLLLRPRFAGTKAHGCDVPA